MKVLVTGSTGFIGGALCRALLEAGHTVRAFHRPTSTLKLLEGLPVEHAIGDLTHAESLTEAMQGMQVVFHAAAQLGNPREQAGRMYSVTVEGTRSVLEAARRAGVERVVHTSSVAALGVPEQFGKPVPALMDENHTWNYRADYWPYGYAKYLAELEVQAAVAQGMDIVIVNPSYVIGPGDVYRQTNSMVVQVARGRLPGAVEGGLNAVGLRDVITGHLAALERGRSGERYILGGQNLTHALLLQKIAGVVGVHFPKVVYPAWLLRLLSTPVRWIEAFANLPVSADLLHQAGYYFYYDTHRATAALGLQPPRPIEESIRLACEWFTANGAIPRPK